MCAFGGPKLSDVSTLERASDQNPGILERRLSPLVYPVLGIQGLADNESKLAMRRYARPLTAVRLKNFNACSSNLLQVPFTQSWDPIDSRLSHRNFFRPKIQFGEDNRQTLHSMCDIGRPSTSISKRDYLHELHFSWIVAADGGADCKVLADKKPLEDSMSRTCMVAHNQLHADA